jgi:hypothetical protein
MTKAELIAKWPILLNVPIEHGPGWYGLLDNMLNAMQNAGFDPLSDQITQVKEKFGCIRLYIEFDPSIGGGQSRFEKVHQAMRHADKSARTCEICGDAAHLMVTNGLVMARCLEHKPVDAKSLREHFHPNIRA